MKDSPKEYAEKLIDEFYKIISLDMPKNPPEEQMISHFLYPEYMEQAKQCALKNIRETIKSIEALENTINKLDNVNLSIFSAISYQIEYWEDVEKEIKKYETKVYL